jgi:hypothetical protein
VGRPSARGRIVADADAVKDHAYVHHHVYVTGAVG